MGEKEDRMAPPHVSGVDLHLQMKDIKTIEELSKKTSLAKERSEMVKKKMGRGCGTKNQYFGS